MESGMNEREFRAHELATAFTSSVGVKPMQSGDSADEKYLNFLATYESAFSVFLKYMVPIEEKLREND